MVLFFDGACEPKNPGGVPTWGYVIYRADGSLWFEDCGVSRLNKFPKTNNVAEYHALGHGLRRLLDEGHQGDVMVYGDSQLVINQVFGEWKCRPVHLTQLRRRILQLVSELRGQVIGSWVPRDRNEYADALSKKAYVQTTGRQPPERRRQ